MFLVVTMVKLSMMYVSLVFQWLTQINEGEGEGGYGGTICIILNTQPSLAYMSCYEMDC